jgi:hypothetical protein
MPTMLSEAGNCASVGRVCMVHVAIACLGALPSNSFWWAVRACARTMMFCGMLNPKIVN